jgi:hypothetical protein
VGVLKLVVLAKIVKVSINPSRGVTRVLRRNNNKYENLINLKIYMEI